MANVDHTGPLKSNTQKCLKKDQHSENTKRDDGTSPRKRSGEKLPDNVEVLNRPSRLPRPTKYQKSTLPTSGQRSRKSSKEKADGFQYKPSRKRSISKKKSVDCEANRAGSVSGSTQPPLDTPPTTESEGKSKFRRFSLRRKKSEQQTETSNIRGRCNSQQDAASCSFTGESEGMVIGNVSLQLDTDEEEVFVQCDTLKT